MKLLCKLILLVLLAKVLVSPPQTGHEVVTKVGQLTLRDVAGRINDAWTSAETWVRDLWSSSEARSKTVPHRGATAHHPAS
jgi:hypothetical protein